MKLSIAPPLWIIAAAAIVAGLYFFRDTLTQFALALILYLMIDGFARWLDERIPFMPRILALPIAVVFIIGFVTLVASVVAVNVSSLAGNLNGYEARLNQIVAQAYSSFGAGPAPTVSQLIAEVDPQRLIGEIGAGIQGVAADLVFILIYVAFMFAAAAMMSRKITAIFPDKADRAHALDVMSSIRTSIDRYFYVQTAVSFIICALTYATLVAIGLENAVFWTFLIFFLNYIPTIGSLVAVALPTAFAMVQFPDLARVAAVGFGVGIWQFVIGNFVQPRMTGDSLNLSAAVMLLALGMWSAIWGIAGAFLAAPLTVMLMIVLAQFPATRWIAILISADARPAIIARQDANET